MIKVFLVTADIVLINAGFVGAFLLRYNMDIPARRFLPYQYSFLFLTIIYILAFYFFGVYKARFRSSWVLFTRIAYGLFIGTLISISFVYIFRSKLSAFPTSIFCISLFVNLILVFKFKQFFLKRRKRIKKQVVILGGGNVDKIVGKKSDVVRKRIQQIPELLEFTDIDEIIISEKITNIEELNLLLYLKQNLNIDILFVPSLYLGLLPDRINGHHTVKLLSTFVGRQHDFDEFLIRTLDILGSFFLFLVCLPVMAVIALLIKVMSPGPVIYKQKRVGKDGKLFTLYKFRTMERDAEKVSGLTPVTTHDPRIIRTGRFMRKTRLDELPQLINILQGKMSLVGPRPENLHRVNLHKALQGMRLAIKPGLTGLAQIRSFYDLHPRHKIKYDFLYIQKRTIWLNIYILFKTIRVVFAGRGK